jgi:uncharacterized membrane protein
MMRAVFTVFLATIFGVVLLPYPVTAQPQKGLALTLVPDSHYVEARAGRESLFSLEVRNTGRVRLTQIVLSADQPAGWSVTLEPAQIEGINQGGVDAVRVNIRPPATATKGQYTVRFTAVSGDARTTEIVQVRVSSASYWMWVGIGATAAVVAAFIVIFLRMGRRV